MPGYWFEAMEWLRTNTPEPFASPDYYYARYDASESALRRFTVMNWWDQGYWIMQTARRVPISNPTQSGANERRGVPDRDRRSRGARDAHSRIARST